MKKINERLAIQNTSKYGKGVFAIKDIKKGEVVWILAGRRMDIKDLVNKVNKGNELIDDPFQIGRRTYLDLDNVSRTFNHSCDPTCGIRKNSEMFALRDIHKGEEITYDYSLTIAPTDWKMRCKCGSKNCRKIIGDVRSIPKSRRRDYTKQKAAQRYMRALLKEIDNGVYVVPTYELVALEKLGKNKHN